MSKKGNNNEEPLEKQLWKAADKLRKNIDAAEYKSRACLPFGCQTQNSINNTIFVTCLKNQPSAISYQRHKK